MMREESRIINLEGEGGRGAVRRVKIDEEEEASEPMGGKRWEQSPRSRSLSLSLSLVCSSFSESYISVEETVDGKAGEGELRKGRGGGYIDNPLVGT